MKQSTRPRTYEEMETKRTRSASKHTAKRHMSDAWKIANPVKPTKPTTLFPETQTGLTEAYSDGKVES